ncbi:nucleotide sugar dehydrogenase [Streptomyces sp. HPF1205]|uniref:nucleotide sugar dehydrogenase n=1 Tax=Streptomyces sp. HPF1205 TaxID=2873262 RepID=UPI001CED6B43|nr:nucleotide sugar dehydrogenase [Streptomyces sp. HPF1205]
MDVTDASFAHVVTGPHPRTAGGAPAEGAAVPAQWPLRPYPTVAVVGLGYVGLPSALALHAAGHRVIGVDTDPRRLHDVRAGRVDLPPEQRERLAGALAGRGVRLTGDPGASAAADAVVICVPTPVDPHRVPDLRALRSACSAAVEHAVPGQLLLLTSTSYVGTTRDLLIEPLARRGLRAGADVLVAFAPERIDPGDPAHAPERTPRVVGGEGPRSTEAAVALLAATAPSIHRAASPEAAEMSKLWENTFRAVNIALANELADTCLEFGLDPGHVLEAAGTKPFGFLPFRPGPGVGGHCIPCDPHYLLWHLRARGAAAPVVESAMTAIAGRPAVAVRRIREALAARGTAPAGARVLLLGVAYKPGVADVRESPALEILDRLAALGADVSYSDPLVPALEDAGGPAHRCVPDPRTGTWDLVVLHTRQPGMDLGWLDLAPAVLDLTYGRRPPVSADGPA